jgi:hypothetical protein
MAILAMILGNNFSTGCFTLALGFANASSIFFVHELIENMPSINTG